MAPTDAAVAGPAHPFLSEPLLHLGPGLSQATTDAAIVEQLWECLRLRPVFDRSDRNPNAPLTGHIQFESLDRAEKALATVSGVALPTGGNLSLHISASPSDDPRAMATPRIVKSLPREMTSGTVFDLFRPFGAIEKVAMQTGAPYPGGGAPVFKGTAIVTFYEEDCARIATEDLHCAEVGGQTIIVQEYNPARARKSDVRINGAPSLSASQLGQGHPTLSAHAASWTPTRSFSATSQTSNFSQHSPSYSPTQSRRSPSFQAGPGTSSPGVDPRNLFVKSLDLSLSTDDLRAAFEQFGTITSARVMFDDATGLSKGFGFVSFSAAEDAALALQSMNGARLGPSGKPIVVSPHEPKKVREEKLRERFSGLAVSDGGSVDSSARSAGGLPTSEPMSPSHSAGGISLAAPESPPESPAPVLTEHERLEIAVSKIESERVDEIVVMLEGLKKKERAMCLFDADYLKQKVADAVAVLDVSDDEEEAPAPVATKPVEKTVPGPSTLAELGRLPAKDILDLINSNSTSALGVTPVPGPIKLSTDEFMDSLEGQPIGSVKQQLGQKLHKAVKACGVKGAPKITIQLLDSEELRPLAHLIDYQDVLREKVLALAEQK